MRLTPVYCHERVSNNDSIYDCLVEYKVKYWGYLCELGVPSDENADKKETKKAVAICKRWKELRETKNLHILKHFGVFRSFFGKIEQF